MENESNLISNFDFVEDNIFRTEYENQNIHNFKAFKNWKISNIKKYGKDAKLFHCLNDKIYFYAPYYKCNENYPYYKVKCPKCNKYICYCCSSINNDEHFECCMKRRIYACFHIKRKYVNGPVDHLCECCRSSLFYMIPFINMISIIGSIARLLYYQCICKVDPDASYEGHLQRHHI